MRQPHRQAAVPSSERHVENSNATLNAVLGNSHQRSWMINGLGQSPVRPTPRRASTSNNNMLRSPTEVQAAALNPTSPVSTSTRVGTSQTPNAVDPEGHVPRAVNASAIRPPTATSNTAQVQTSRLQVLLQDGPEEAAGSGEVPVGVDCGRQATTPANAIETNILDRHGSHTSESSSATTTVPRVSRAPEATSGTTDTSLLSPSPEVTHTSPSIATGVVPEAVLAHLRQSSAELRRRQNLDMVQQLNRTNRASANSTPQTLQPNTSHITAASIPQRRQRTQIPSMPSLRSRVNIIDTYLRQAGGDPSFGNLERTRLSILRDACTKEDSFYVAIHQLFCTWDVDQSKVMTLYQVHSSITPPTANVMQAGMRILAQLFRPNSVLNPRSRIWFADFPSPLADLLRTSEPYRRIVQAALHCIARLGDAYVQLWNDCQKRNYPPLVEELVDRFGLMSPLLQGIAFTLARRNLGVEDGEIASQMENLFQTDRTEYEALLARVNTDRPPMTHELSERRGRLAGTYSGMLSQARLQSSNLAHGSGSSTSPANLAVPEPALVNLPPRQQSALGTPHSLNAGASPDLNTAAQSMSLNSPNANVGMFVPNPLQPVNGRPPQQNMPNNVSSNVRLPSGQPPVLRNNDQPHRNSRTNYRSINVLPLREIEGEIQAINAALSTIQSQYPMPPLPAQTYQQQQAYLHRRDFLYRQQAELRFGQQMFGQRPIDMNTHNHSQTPPQPQGAFQQYSNGNLPAANMVPNHGYIQPGLQQQRQHAHAHPSNARQRAPVNSVVPAPPSVSYASPYIAPNAHVPVPLPLPNNGILQPTSYEDAYGHLPRELWPVIPPIGVHHKAAPPNPEKTALHQAHLRSPILVPKSLSVPEESSEKRYYQVVRSLIQPPVHLGKKPIVDVVLTVPQTEHDLVGKIKPMKRQGQLPEREYTAGTLQYRMRCIRKKLDETECTESEWVVSDTAWPSTVYIQLTSGSDHVAKQIEIRRKKLHGKDLPVDLTPYIQFMPLNTPIRVTVSIPGRPKCYIENSYFFAIEVIEIFNHDQLMTACKLSRRPASETLASLKASLAGPTISADEEDDDDEISLISSEVTLDLTDPFSSLIFTIPVRGKYCLHRECFDLETFLLSRVAKPNKPSPFYPTMIDVWRCPICNRDARPANLLVDEFLVNIRAELEEMGVVKEVKMIVVDKDGQWRPKSLGGNANGHGGGNRAGSAKRKTPGDESDDSGSDGDGNLGNNGGRRRLKSASAGNAVAQSEIMVIDLSD